MSNLEYWIWFSSRRGLSAKTRRAALEQFGGPKELYFAPEQEVRRIPDIRAEEVQTLMERDGEAAGRVFRRCEELGVSVLTLQDAAYPERLRNITDPPSVLYVLGRLPDVDAEPCVTVVGTRSCTPYGEKMARNIAYELASKGAVVVTGLAGGVDSRAAEGALLAGGSVIGVLGVAINDVYPRYNARLYEDVRANGALVSEYPPDAKGSSAWFPLRDRIMAGLGLATVVVEAPLRSGALITAHRALDYGRDVFAVPGASDAPKSQGCNNLLREGAAIAENGWDVLREYEQRFPGKIFPNGRGAVPEELAVPEETRAKEQQKDEDALHSVKKGGGFWKFRVRTRKPKEADRTSVLASQLEGLSEDQLKIVGVMTKENMHVDDIVDLSRLPAATVLSELTVLQIKGFVSQQPGKRFTLNISK